MSLRVWLPLNGNLNNQGLTDITVTNSGATVDNNGKIGKCYAFNGKYISFNRPLPNPCSAFTVCGWVKLSTGYATNYGLHLISFESSYGRICISKDGLAVRVLLNYNGTNSATGSTATASSISANVWNHYAVTFDSGKINIYINGQLDNSYTIGISQVAIISSILKVGTYLGEPSKGCVNDFRLYDHALSPKEVEILSRGLVCHYPLSDTAIESSTNIYTELNSISTSCYNGSTGKYGYGSNSDIYKTTGEFNGRQSMKIYMGTSGNQANPYIYFSSLFVSDGTNQPAYKTLSFDYYGTIGTWLNFYKLGSGSGTVTWTNNSAETKSGSYTNNGYISVVPNKWNHITLTFHGTTSANAEFGYGILGAAHTSSTSNYWLFANIMLEEKDHETMFTPYGTTRSDTTVYDTSGYQNNGTINGSLTVSSDTARYSISTIFDTNTDSITPVSFLSLGQTIDEMSVSIWFKTNTLNNTQPNLWSLGENSFLRVRLASATSLWYYTKVGNVTGNTTTYTTKTLTDNIWHHVVYTFKEGIVTMYLDGTQVGTTNHSSNGKYMTCSSISWHIGGYNSTLEKFIGSLSDFRIYATALSAAQVAELYNTAVSVANNGALMGYELVEV